MAGANNDAGKSIEVLKQVPDLAKILDSSSKKNSRKHRKEKDFMLGNAKQFSKSITYPDRGQRLLIEGEFGKVKYQQLSSISIGIQLWGGRRKRTLSLQEDKDRYTPD